MYFLHELLKKFSRSYFNSFNGLFVKHDHFCGEVSHRGIYLCYIHKSSSVLWTYMFGIIFCTVYKGYVCAVVSEKTSLMDYYDKSRQSLVLHRMMSLHGGQT